MQLVSREGEDVETGKRLDVLRNMAVFGALEEDALRFILDRSQIVSAGPGDYFIREGEQGDAVFVLEQGSVEFFKIHQQRDYRMRVLAAGDCFGEMAMLGLYPRSGFVRALDSCEAIRIGYEVLCDLYAHDPRQYTTIIMNMARDLSRRLRDADDRLLACMSGKSG